MFNQKCFDSWITVDLRPPLGVVSIILLLALFAVTSVHAQSSCVYEGKIDYTEEDGNLKFVFSEMPYFYCSNTATIDSGFVA
jgi:hypothetical protein